jgi:glycosyltransferase involved in cell wall biosynthesis
MDRDRFDITVLYYESGGPFLDELRDIGIPVVHLDRRHLGTWGLLKALRREIAARRPDVLDCRLPSGYRFGGLAVAGLGVPLVIAQERSALRYGLTSHLVTRLCTRSADVWIANARAVADHVARDFRFPRDRIRVIHNGIEADLFQASEAHPVLDAFRRQSRRIVLNLGNLSPQKNQRLFLRVSRRLSEHFPDTGFALCGEGDMGDELRRYAAELGLRDRCVFLGAQKNVGSVLRAADLLIQTSDTEGLPNAVMEAMAAGLPVVATRAGGTAEIIEDGQNGLLVPVRDEDGLVAKASSVLADSALARRLGECAARHIRESFSPQKAVREYEDLLETFLPRPGYSDRL